MRVLDFQPPRITAGTRASRDRARLVVNILITDSPREQQQLARQWRKARVAGELVTVRRVTRRVRLAGAAVELYAVVVSLRARSAPTVVS